MTPLTELARVFADIPRPEPLENQCDGCRAGMPVARGIHRNTSGGDFYDIHMCCQKSKYIDPVDADEAVNGVCAQGEDE